MPWSPAQHRLFGMVAGGVIKRKGLTREKAAELVAEGLDNSRAARVGRLKKLKRRRKG